MSVARTLSSVRICIRIVLLLNLSKNASSNIVQFDIGAA